MATCLCCRGLKTLPGMGMLGTRKCDECKGTGKVDESSLPPGCKIVGKALNAPAPDDDVFIVESEEPQVTRINGDKIEISHPAQTLPIEDVESERATNKKKAAASKDAKSKFKWKS